VLAGGPVALIHGPQMVVALVLSIAIQAVASALALAQMRRAGEFRYAWAALSAALLLMVLRRINALGGQLESRAALADLLGLAISVLMAAGVLGLRSLFIHLADQQRVLSAMATTDPLTGIANRRSILDVAEREIRRAMRSKSPLAVLMLDLDHFKEVNDGLGHLAGDRILVEVATTCEKTLRGVDAFGRVGGEEFLAVLPDTDSDQAIAAANRLRAAVTALPQAPATVTVSIGIAVLRRDGHSTAPADPQVLEHLLARADGALYRAKAAGRDCCCVASGDETNAA
jgi:diguanylate cyclase (GGDEF)-like protein